ncbi:MAG TPA: PIN domain-containing protein [Acidimicrobiales bacterium]
MDSAYIICDTTVVSDLRHGGDRCRKMELLTTATKLISTVTRAEMFSGALQAGWGVKKLEDLRATLGAYVEIGIDSETAEAWAELAADCKQRGIAPSPNDLWIAATALRLGVPVAALDNDYTSFAEIQVLGQDGILRRGPALRKRLTAGRNEGEA